MTGNRAAGPAIFKRVNFRVMREMGGADQRRLAHAACLESRASGIRATTGPVPEAETSTSVRGAARSSAWLCEAFAFFLAMALPYYAGLASVTFARYPAGPVPLETIPFLP